MSYSNFTVAIKSTLDFEAKKLADSRSLAFVDLAAESFSSDILESDQLSVCWDFASLQEDPFDPMYTVMFDIGVMAFLDPSQYVSLDLVSMFLDSFRIGKRFQIFDYSGDNLPTQAVGSLYVVASAVTPQQADKATSLRFVSVTAKALRYS